MEIRELKDNVIGRERRLIENSTRMEKIAQENAILSRDLESLIREGCSTAATINKNAIFLKRLHVFKKMILKILHI